MVIVDTVNIQSRLVANIYCQLIPHVWSRRHIRYCTLPSSTSSKNNFISDLNLVPTRRRDNCTRQYLINQHSNILKSSIMPYLLFQLRKQVIYHAMSGSECMSHIHVCAFIYQMGDDTTCNLLQQQDSVKSFPCNVTVNNIHTNPRIP